MENADEKNSHLPMEGTNPPEGQTPPPEEPVSLRKLFPLAKQDLDTLFPEAGMKKLLKDIVRTRKKNERFLQGIDSGQLSPEPEDNGE